MGWMVAGMLLGGAMAQACSVPVFRYAMERWPSDNFQVLIFYEGTLSKSELAAVGILKEGAREANCEVHLINLAGEVDEIIREFLEGQSGKDLPWVAAFYPHRPLEKGLAWSGRLDGDTMGRLLDSPLRQAVGERILAGESAVWVMVESGDSDKDEATAAFLQEELSRLGQELKLPDQEPVFEDGTDEVLREDAELGIAFSLLRVSREDAAEGGLVSMLLRSEPDLLAEEYASEAMVFPIFGRGRALWALVGKGIIKENITEACMFMVGACSCQVKNLNPGTDLLMAMDWESGINESMIKELELPPLFGTSAMLEDDEPEVAADLGDEAGPGDESGPGAAGAEQAAEPTEVSQGILWRNVAIAVGLVIVIAAASGRVLRKKDGGGGH